MVRAVIPAPIRYQLSTASGTLILDIGLSIFISVCVFEVAYGGSVCFAINLADNIPINVGR